MSEPIYFGIPLGRPEDLSFIRQAIKERGSITWSELKGLLMDNGIIADEDRGLTLYSQSYFEYCYGYLLDENTFYGPVTFSDRDEVVARTFLYRVYSLGGWVNYDFLKVISSVRHDLVEIEFSIDPGDHSKFAALFLFNVDATDVTM